MTINYNVTGKERKALVQALAEITFSEAVYAGAPSFAYTVGDYTVDKNGVISCPETVAQEAAKLVIERLKEQGFVPEISENDSLAEADAPTVAEDENGAETDTADVAAETPDVAPEPDSGNHPDEEAESPAAGEPAPDVAVNEEASDEAEETADNTGDEAENPGETATSTDDTLLTITIQRKSLPDDALIRLQAIVLNKKVLFQRAVQKDALPIEITDEEISFPWFTLTGIEGEAAAYGQFITALCQMAREQTRILDKPYDGDNDRFAMRIFMVRMGMKGAQFALARKLMMKHLSGNSGWRYGAPPKKETAQEAGDEENRESNL